jgi:hypothetical protein
MHNTRWRGPIRRCHKMAQPTTANIIFVPIPVSLVFLLLLDLLSPPWDLAFFLLAVVVVSLE